MLGEIWLFLQVVSGLWWVALKHGIEVADVLGIRLFELHEARHLGADAEDAG